MQWTVRFVEQLERIDPRNLSRENQVDYALLKHALQAQLWRLRELREWEWNPLIYTGLAGDAIHGLMSRDFAPQNVRLKNAAERLAQFPRFLEQVRNTLVVNRIPTVHAKTAVAQNRGILKILDHTVRPLMADLPKAEREQLTLAIGVAEKAIRKHQTWLETEMLSHAKGEFRLGIELYEKKLTFALHSPLTRREIRDLAEQRVKNLHIEMYEIAKGLYSEQYPLTDFPEQPSDAFRRAVIRFGLEKANAETPKADEIVATAKRSVAMATDFIRKRDLVTIMPDPLDIIIMPEFQRGVSVAYCDAPGPLATGQKTFYAVSPIPAQWTQKQIRSHLREYNTRSLDVLTIHEAMPGHFLQLAHANRYKGILRHMFQSGVFVEGWAVYTESMMAEEGFRDHDPLLKLITLKWHLRDVTNAILDHAVHVDGISRNDAMRLLLEDAFQEEREAAGKWTRAQLTSAQLSTYFVGYLEHVAMRREAEKEWGDDFDLKTYHDKVLSFGSIPTQFVEALLHDREIPIPGAILQTSE
ncbi:MAG: DUF885 domain-containing protein [Planctomycetes bacterium]|nr:DUF885 domain-containing protein [Planctomycetota bacterium]MCH9723844.1 DUF885 domain-containing protein [Planctomycetota bacterium]MCH9776251.1 DUF885 domain-containing protein [Planctomycetota bacterium]MCH9792571.1 DUF885 domain-containing protein [Planctomycetota bacterium]